MRPLTALLLTDGRPGHYHLAEGVIAAITRVRPVEIRRAVAHRRSWMPGRILAVLLRAGLPPRAVLALGYGLTPKAVGTPDFIVSAGGETLAANAAAACLTGAPNVFCGSLRHLPPQAFAVIVSSYQRHAALPRHVVALKPNGMDPDRLGRRLPASVPDPAEPPRLAGLLVGGNSGYFRYEADEWDTLFEFLRRSHAESGMRWIVSTSRRTSDAVADKLGILARTKETPIEELIDFRAAGPGTLPSLFSRVDAILCTEDSSTMLSEAVCARLPVVGVSPRQHAFKDEEREYREFMRASNWCRFVPLGELDPQRFAQELAGIQPLRENHLDRLAALLRERLPSLFA